MRKQLFTTLLLTSVALTSFGQTPCLVCAEALKQGTKDEFFKEKKYTLDESVNTLYSYDYEFWEKYQSSETHSASLDAAFSIFSASFSSSSSSSQKRETFNKQKSAYMYSRTMAQNDYEKISQSLISKIPYNTFSECIKNTCGNGLFVDYETTGDNIIVTVRLVITQGQPTPTTLKNDPTVANAVPINFNLQKGIVLQPNSSISALYRRTSEKDDAIFSFDFEYYTTTPKQTVVKATKHQNTTLPVGTIVASVLDYANFCSLNDIPLNGDNSEIIWVPADGRNVAGSVYAERQTNVPDLRGTFLRGLNVFDPINNPSYSHPEQKNPENKYVNEIQLQSVQGHTHPIDDPGHVHTIELATVGVGGSGTVAYRPVGFGTGATLGAKNSTTNITIKENAGQETRPTNISVYYYIKIN